MCLLGVKDKKVEEGAKEAKEQKEEKEQIEVKEKTKKPVVIRVKRRRGLLTLLNPLRYLFPRRVPPARPWFEIIPLVTPVRGEVLEKYVVAGGEKEWGTAVFITQEGSRGFYLVNEPELEEEEREIFRILLEEVTVGIRKEERAVASPQYVEGALWRAARDLGLLDVVKENISKYRYYLLRNLFGYWYLHVPMLDDNVEEISVTGARRPVMVIHRRHADLGWLETNISFPEEEELASFCRRLAQAAGKPLSAASPMAEFTLTLPQNGRAPTYRVAATLGGEVGGHSTLTVRRHVCSPLTLPFLCSTGALSPLEAAYLWTVAEEKGPIMIIGGTGSGKTTLLNSICLTIPPWRKVATLEDTPEIFLPSSNWLSLHTRVGLPGEIRFDVGLMDLIKNVLRQRPDYLVVGETRGEEIKGLVHAAAVGHGCITTFHAGSLEEAMVRWKSPPMDLTEPSLNLFWSYALVAQISKRETTLRRVVSVWETEPGTEFRIREVFRWNPSGDSFSPGSPSEVVRRSRRLVEAYRARGLGTSELHSTLGRRARLIQRLGKEKRFQVEDFLAALGKEEWKGG